MSYILDALRKLEQNRQHGESLTFLTFQGKTPRKRKKHHLWPYLLVVVLMLNAGVIFWWIGPWQSPGKRMTVDPPAVRGAKPAIPASTPAPAPATDEAQSRLNAEKMIVTPKEIKEQPRSTKRDPIATSRSAMQQPPAPTQAPIPFNKPSPAPPARTEVTPPADIGVQRSPAPRQAPIAEEAPVPFGKPSPTSPVRADVTPPPDARVLKLAELPASVAGGLPEFKISFLYYIAEPQSRVVWINDRTLHEGESLSEGLKVEQINERSVVMNYRGWRFQLELNR